MKIGIVGPEESKWKSKGQIRMAKERIEGILRRHATKEALHENIDVNPMFAVQEGCQLITIVSGHCPKGGIDIWAEEVADKLRIQKEIHPAEVNQWEDKVHSMGNEIDDYKEGYKSRNIDMAKSCDVLYCIVPKIENESSLVMHTKGFCKHCNRFGHSTNGGCWTMKCAKKLGKETNLIIID